MDKIGKKGRNSLFLLVGLLLLVLPLVFIVSKQTLASFADSGTNISVNYSQPIRTLNPLAVGGVDESAYGAPDVLVNDPLQQQRLRTLGTKYMRINLKYATSGDHASGIVCGADGCDTRWSGDQWVTAIKALGATPVVEDPTNPSDLPALVKHFNIDTNNKVERWLGGMNEPNLHGEDATTYSNDFNTVYDAMKAVDPGIKIGGPTVAWYDPNFLQTFLTLSGSRVDFLDFHGYAQGSTNQLSYPALFAKAVTYETDITNLYQKIQATVPSRASQISIEVGEWDLDDAGHLLEYTQFDNAWGASTIGHIIRAGGLDMVYADKGNLLLEKGTEISGGVLDETTSMYHALGMYTGEGLFRHFGSTMVQASTTLPNVEVYASDHEKNIVVINEDPSATQKGVFQLNGVSSGTVDVWKKDQTIAVTAAPQHAGTVTITNGSFSYTLPPFSVTTFVIGSSSTPSTAIPTQTATVSPTATAIPTQTATVSPTATAIPTQTATATATAIPTQTATATPVTGGTCVGDGIYVYQDTNYRGVCTKFTIDVAHLSGTPVGSDTASSIKIVGSYTATLYADSNYQGTSSVVTASVPDLAKLAVGSDTISSLQIHKN